MHTCWRSRLCGSFELGTTTGMDERQYFWTPAQKRQGAPSLICEVMEKAAAPTRRYAVVLLADAECHLRLLAAD